MLLGSVCFYRVLSRRPQEQALMQALENKYAHTHEEHQESFSNRVKGWFGGGSGRGEGTTSGN